MPIPLVSLTVGLSLLAPVADAAPPVRPAAWLSRRRRERHLHPP